MLGKPQIQMQNRLQDSMPGICVARNQTRTRVCNRYDYRNTSTELTGVYWKWRQGPAGEERAPQAQECSFETDPMPSWKSTSRRPLGARHNCLRRPREGKTTMKEETTERKELCEMSKSLCSILTKVPESRASQQ